MRATIPLLLPLLGAVSIVSGLPHSVSKPDLASRQTPNRPKYSVVPLEPDNDDESEGSDDGSGGSTGGNKGSGDKDSNGDDKGHKADDGDPPSDDNDDEDYVTIIETVTQTHSPVTVTHSVHPEPVTQTKLVPTTVISVIDMEGGETTVTVRPEPETIREPPAALSTKESETDSTTTTTTTASTTIATSAESVAEETTAETTSSSESSESSRLPEPTPIAPVVDSQPDYDTPPADGAHQWQPEPPAEHIPTTLTTLHTITTEAVASSTSTAYDNGQWHTTYPSWNETSWRADDV